MKLHIYPLAPRDILDEGDNLVAKVFVTRDIAKDAGREALARQFAASGELLEALRKCARWMETYSPALCSDSLASALAAISAAEGK